MRHPWLSYWSVFDLAGKGARLTILEKEIENPTLWNDTAAAKATMKELSRFTGFWKSLSIESNSIFSTPNNCATIINYCLNCIVCN